MELLAAKLFFLLVITSILAGYHHRAAATAMVHHHQQQQQHGGCIPSERAALLSFKKGITGDPNDVLASWQDVDHDCCRWRGVKCSNRTGHVLELRLRNDAYMEIDDDYNHRFGLSGQISPSLLSLQHLEHLDLSMNELEGPSSRFPEFICSLRSLRYLNLSGIYFQDRLPSQIGNLSNLQYFELLGGNYGSMYSTDMSWITHLSSLRYFGVAGVNFSTVLDWAHLVNQIPSLRVLVLSECSLASAEQSLLRLNLTKLEKLDLSYNSFHHPVASGWFWGVASLQYLDLSSNNLYGQFPDAMGNMTSLRVLDFSHNWNGDLTTPKLTNLCNLEVLALGANSMHGDIKLITERLPKCAWSKLHSNNLRGYVPYDIGKLNNLITLDLRNNSFDGIITEKHFVSLTSLKRIDLSSNRLNISVDSSWLPSFKLEAALFAYCQMGPVFPAWLKSQVDIRALDISSTGIKDNLPDWLWTTFHRGRYLNIAHNQISGKLPENMEAMPWAILWLGSNELTGPIPSLPKDLDILDISMNSFTGPMPSTPGVRDIETLVMFSNRITGNIPTSICELQGLADLDLSNNLLEGEFPQCFQPNKIEYLHG